MLKFHVAIASWGDLPKEAALCSSRDQIAWSVDDNISASLSIGGCASVGRWRSHTSESFLERTKHDVLVMIDHDQWWEGGAVERLVSSCYMTKGVVSAVISKKRIGAGLACSVPDGGAIEPGKDTYIPARFVGAGFVAIHRRALVRLKPHTEAVAGFGGIETFRTYFLEGTTPAKDGGKLWLGEDAAFCTRCHAAGVPIHIDCLPRVDHIGRVAFTAEDGLK